MDNKDISPELLERLQDVFERKMLDSEQAKILAEVLEAGTATYVQAGKFATEVGEVLAEVFAECLSGEVLPNGKMYWNIAENAVLPMLKNNHKLVSNYTAQAQESINASAGLGIKAQTAPLNTSRTNGILSKLCKAENYDTVSWVLNKPVINFTQNIVDDMLQRNASFQRDAGLHPTIIRRALSNACPWCRDLAGVYDYTDDLPDDLFRRHENCRCTLDYRPAGGKKVQDAWTKKWKDE